ncbi:unnamed protein product [Phaedon cochleariae]|uniref:Uncharacterized protein n=1 Tax=Phaedon cochleariae TaxID=80249 RepID=A0A9N9SGC3_PHACE|nr:unnamed protein product [Phaedon cochleariae]
MGDLNQKKKEEKPRDIICMPFSIKVFRLYWFFPSAKDLLNPGKMFYIKFVLIAVYSSLVLVGSTLHLVKSIKDNSYNHAELDIGYIISMLAGYGLICSYITKVRFAVQLYLSLSDFSEFEKPYDFDETNKKFNRYAKYHYGYVETLVSSILLGSNIFRGDQCREDNEKRGLNEVCGLFTYTWMPFNIDFFPVKQLYLFQQLFGTHYVYMVADSPTAYLKTKFTSIARNYQQDTSYDAKLNNLCDELKLKIKQGDEIELLELLLNCKISGSLENHYFFRSSSMLMAKIQQNESKQVSQEVSVASSLEQKRFDELRKKPSE